MVRKNIFQIYLLLFGFSMLALPSVGFASIWVDPKTPTNAMPVSGGTAWKLAFSDEFNTNSLDTSKWGIDVSATSRSSRPERGISDWWWKAENVSMDGSNVVLMWSHARVDVGIPPISIQRRASMITGDWEHAWAHSPTNGTNMWMSPVPDNGFFRLCVTNMP